MSSSPNTMMAALKGQLVKLGGLALTFTGLLLGAVALYVLPEWKVTGQALTATVILASAFVWICGAALREALEHIQKLSSDLSAALAGNRYAPKVVQAMLDPLDKADLILLLEANRLFGQSMLVSLYYEDERGFELFVGSGQVANVQTNGLIQIAVTSWEDVHADVKRGVIAQEPSKISRLLIRPAPTTRLSGDLSAAHLVTWTALDAFLKGQRDDRQL